MCPPARAPSGREESFRDALREMLRFAQHDRLSEKYGFEKTLSSSPDHIDTLSVAGTIKLKGRGHFLKLHAVVTSCAKLPTSLGDVLSHSGYE